MTQRTNQQIEDEDALDERGILKDGHSLRVPQYMRDAAVRPAWQDTADRHFNRKGVKVHDGRGGTAGLHRPGFRASQLDSSDEREQAYSSYEQSLQDAWRADGKRGEESDTAGSYPLSAGAGNSCTIDGAPGVLTRVGDVLMCRPIKQASSGKDHGLVMDSEYQKYEASLREAWRHR